MIASQLNGGLGNQLFQYAIARALASRQGELPYLDLSLLLQPDSTRDFSLDGFKINAVANRQHLSRWWFHRVTKKKLAFLMEDPSMENMFPADNIFLQGYWQNRFYFDHIRELLLKEIVPVTVIESVLLSQVQGSSSIAIHIRRGDYINNNLHQVCTEKYFLDAIRHLKGEIKDPCFFVFSDDIEYCRSFLAEHPDIIFVEEESAVAAFWLMKSCKHFILSNSSFSWWAQYLNTNNKIVVAPPQWFNDPKITQSGLYYDSWKILETV